MIISKKKKMPTASMRGQKPLIIPDAIGVNLQNDNNTELMNNLNRYFVTPYTAVTLLPIHNSLKKNNRYDVYLPNKKKTYFTS